MDKKTSKLLEKVGQKVATDLLDRLPYKSYLTNEYNTNDRKYYMGDGQQLSKEDPWTVYRVRLCPDPDDPWNFMDNKKFDSLADDDTCWLQFYSNEDFNELVGITRAGDEMELCQEMFKEYTRAASVPIRAGIVRKAKSYGFEFCGLARIMFIEDVKCVLRKGLAAIPFMVKLRSEMDASTNQPHLSTACYTRRSDCVLRRACSKRLY